MLGGVLSRNNRERERQRQRDRETDRDKKESHFVIPFLSFSPTVFEENVEVLS